jgi:hypothetical protein
MIAALTGSIGLTVAVLILWLVRKDRLHVNHGLGWMMVAAAFALLGFAPSLIDELAVRLGVSYPPALALTLAVTVLVLKTLSMDIERSHLQMRNQRLTQRLAMLEADIEKLRTSLDSDLPSLRENPGVAPNPLSIIDQGEDEAHV